MKSILISLLSIFIFACTNNTAEKSIPKTNVVVIDSTKKKVTEDLAFHWEKYKQLYAKLQLDSLTISNNESYRIVISHSWGLNAYGGQPTSITFRKKGDSSFAEIKDGDGDFNTPSHTTKVNVIQAKNFDSVRVMFNRGAFWDYPYSSRKGDRIATDPDYIFFEAVKNGRHKLISQLHQTGGINILDNWRYNFFILSNYNKKMTDDFLRDRKNPPGKKNKHS